MARINPNLREVFMKRAKRIWTIIMIGTAIAAGVAFSFRPPLDRGAIGAARAQSLRYHCPMHPAMVSDHPADCPICSMRMVPMDDAETVGIATESATASAASAPMPERVHAAPVAGRAAVKVSAQKRQLIGARTAPVERAPLVREIRAVGRVAYDETRLRTVSTKVGGWVEHLFANTTGQLVKQGQPLLSIYSPDLVSSVQEYVLAVRGREQLADSPAARDTTERLVTSARRRLELLGVTRQQIRELDESGDVPTAMTLVAPIGGSIIARNVTQGDRIEPGTKLLDIAELRHVWVVADVYEYELPFVQAGHTATITLSYLPGQTFEGRIAFVYPTVSETTRTATVRIEVPNDGLTLKPEMYAQVEIHADLGQRLTVPDSAVISTGTRDLAFVDRGDGYFEPRELKVGLRLPDRMEVLNGVVDGEQVLTSGNFLIDSESNMKAALAAVGSAPPAATPEHTH